MLEIKNLHKAFIQANHQRQPILTGLDLIVNDGDFISILGNNGTGKSTLFNLISGSILSDEGEIILNGTPITLLPEYKRSKFIGRVFQNPLKGTAPNLTVAENLALAYGRQNRRNLNWALTPSLRRLFCETLAKAKMGLEDKMDIQMKYLSGGQCQVVALLMSTINPPQLLLLDEHTAALDPNIAKQVMEFTKNLIEEKNLTALMITHHLEDAIEYGNRLIMLRDGKVGIMMEEEEKSKLSLDVLRDLYHIRG